MSVSVPILPFQYARQDTTMEVVDLMAHPLASIMGFILYIIGGFRPYGPPSCLNYGQSNLNSTKITNQGSYYAHVCG